MGRVGVRPHRLPHRTRTPGRGCVLPCPRQVGLSKPTTLRGSAGGCAGGVRPPSRATRALGAGGPTAGLAPSHLIPLWRPLCCVCAHGEWVQGGGGGGP